MTLEYSGEYPWPLEPLLEAAAPGQYRRWQVHFLAAHVGVTERTIWRRLHQGLDELRADRWATMLGLHPWEVWGAAWWAAA